MRVTEHFKRYGAIMITDKSTGWSFASNGQNTLGGSFKKGQRML